MKKTAERILILTSFLIGLIMLFLICTPTIKSEPFIRTYDLLQDGIIEPIKNFTDSIQDGSGNINADTITADTITAAQLNIINIDLTTISGTTAIYLNLDVTDTADIKDLSADTITALKIITGTLQVDTIVEHTIYYETTVINIDSMVVNGNIEVNAEVKAKLLTVSDTTNLLKKTDNISGDSIILNDTQIALLKGDTGPQGIQGEKGDTGATGLKGDKGDKGDTGQAGAKGDTGPQGIQGVKGDRGDTGEKGDTGLQGLKGDKGDTGPTPDTSIFLTTSDTTKIKTILSLPDTLYFTVLNSNIIYADTSISDDTNIITGDSCFVIIGDSYGVNLNDFDFSYKILADTGVFAGTWIDASALVYFIPAGNGIVVFKGDIKTYQPNTIKFNFWRVKK